MELVHTLGHCGAAMTREASRSPQVMTRRGREVVRLTAGDVQVDVIPDKGADIVGVKWLPLDLDLLWESPWGLRARGAPSMAAGSESNWLENYPGGWQTIFPNGGEAAPLGGTEQGFHGEACLSPWLWRSDSPTELELETRLVRSPFRLRKRITLDDNRIIVTEDATNEGSVTQDVMWSHHPAFGAPFLDPTCTVASNASTFVADDERDAAQTELRPGHRSSWPNAESMHGELIDLGRMPQEGQRTERFGYMGGFPEAAWASIFNPHLPLRATLMWDGGLMPHAWFWLETGAGKGFPWYGAAYVLAIEPATTVPGQGLTKSRQKGGKLLSFEPGQSRTAQVVLHVTSSPPT